MFSDLAGANYVVGVINTSILMASRWGLPRPEAQPAQCRSRLSFFNDAGLRRVSHARRRRQTAFSLALYDLAKLEVGHDAGEHELHPEPDDQRVADCKPV
jgi:hypothetical protein